MINIIWKFQVNLNQAKLFRLFYSPDGAWAILFRHSKEYHGTILLKEHGLTDVYLTIDRWNNYEVFESFKTQNAKAYHDLDILCEKLTLNEQMIGVFEET